MTFYLNLTLANFAERVCDEV